MSTVLKANSKPETHSKEHFDTNSSNILYLSSRHNLHKNNKFLRVLGYYVV